MTDALPYRIADRIFEHLAAAGIEHCFYLPGGGAMHLNDALARQTRITPIHCHHEQAAGIAAETYARLHPSGIGLLLVTTGPGATNAITPLAGAAIDSIPLLIIAGQVKQSDRLPPFTPLRQRGVQEVPSLALAAPLAKRVLTLDDPVAVDPLLTLALRELTSGRPGPIWLEVPLNIQGAPYPLPRTPIPPLQPSAPPVPPPPLLAELLAALAESERPLLLVGHGVRIARGQQPLRRLLTRLPLPLVATWLAADLLPHDHPCYLGRVGQFAARAANFAVQNCDLLITLGARLDPTVTAYRPRDFARAARRVHIDIDPHQLAEHPPGALTIVADAAAFLIALDQTLSTAPPSSLPNPDRWGEWRARCADWKVRYPLPELPLSSEAEEADAISSLLSLTPLISEHLPPGITIVTGSSGQAIEVLQAALTLKEGQRLIHTSGLGAMGYGLPAAIGAALANRSAPVLCFESDGSLMLNLQELATLRALNLPILLIILDNRGYGSIRASQRRYFGRLLGVGPETGLYFPDWSRLLAAFDLPSTPIAGKSHLTVALTHHLTHPETLPHALLLPLPPEETLQPRVATHFTPDGQPISMPLEDMTPLLPLETLQREMATPLSPESYRVRAIDPPLSGEKSR
ncbi:MAG: thiamine pyrophosphate-binding protein [Hydrogenophilus sp.]|nr:thiamine pyrophosphate-binding protein [Hydrogenophilus sp.]